MNKILTVSIAAYNAEKYLKKCLSSLINVRYLDCLEILIVNDGSSDSTLNIANEYKEKYPASVFVIDKENGGHGSTINAGIRTATGKYFKIVDADDWVETENLDRLIEFLKQSNSDLVLNSYYEVSASDNSKKIRYSHDMKPEYTKESIAFEEISSHIELAMHSMTIKTDILKRVGPVIDEKCFYVDVEYTIFPIPYINTVSILNYPIYDYLLGTATQSVNLKVMQNRRQQHLKVVKRIVDFYEADVLLNAKSEIRELIEKRIIAAIYTQYILYLKMGKISVKKEFAEFDCWLKKASPNLYKSFALLDVNEWKKYLYAVKSIRKHSYRNYFIWNLIIQAYNKARGKQ